MKLPTRATLKKYGLTEQEFLEMWDAQGRACPICGQDKDTIVIDHEHVPNWRKMKPEKRKSFVRGLPCNWCNRWIIGRGATRQKLIRGAIYLGNYERRKQK